jgi:hypothetical protein
MRFRLNRLKFPYILFYKYENKSKDISGVYIMNSNNIIESINLLPEDVVLYEIFPNLKNELLAVLNKKYYTKFHTCLKKNIPDNKYEGYIRRTARHDHFFVFEQILGENFDKWRSMKKYEYKSYIFDSYLHFLIQFCIDNNSHKCRELINKKASSVLNKNWHKNSRIQSIRWSN